MSLPFLPNKKIVSIVVSRRNKSQDLNGAASEMEAPENEEKDPSLQAACEDLLKAIDNKSVHDLYNAISDAFHALEEMPHEEGPHIEEEE